MIIDLRRKQGRLDAYGRDEQSRGNHGQGCVVADVWSQSRDSLSLLWFDLCTHCWAHRSLYARIISELMLDGRVTPTRGFATYDDFCRAQDLILVCPESPEPYSYVPLCHLAVLRALDWDNHSTNPRVAPDASYPHELSGLLHDVMGVYLDTNKVLLLRGPDRNVDPPVRALQQAMPRLDQQQRDELRSTFSACHEPFAGAPPFRCSHHSITSAGLVVGGRAVFLGEITLANHGLLLLSDIENWTPTTLATLRTALRTRESRIVRAEGI